MLQTIVLVLYITLCQGFPNDLDQLGEKIVGGNDTDIENYPYMAQLLTCNRYHCGSLIISELYILTAAHCLGACSARCFWVRYGTSRLNNGGTVVGIKSFTTHPQYNSRTLDNDIAVALLEKGIVFSPVAQAIQLPSQGQRWPTGAEGIVVGWGRTRENGPYSRVLQVAQVSIVDLETCKINNSPAVVTESMLCAGLPDGGVDSCQGDSGGPLTIDGLLAGVVSWGYGCGRPNRPGVYADVGVLRSFINETTGI